MKARDGCCCFPGCAATTGIEGHHITHWADGGETSLSNLANLCHHHHRAVHELGYTMHRMDDDLLAFRRPDGALIEASPPSTAVLGCAQHALVQVNEEHGVYIDARTGIPHWDGCPMDAVRAVEALLQAKGELEYRG